MSSGDEIRNARIVKRDALAKTGHNPYKEQTQRTHRIVEILQQFDSLEKETTAVTIAGRIVSIRGQGAISFMTLYDGSSDIQIVLKSDVIEKELFTLAQEALDIGDIIEVTGSCFVTKRGEQSILVATWEILTKSLLPLPEKWHGLKDTDTRYRKRYLDLLADREVKEMFLRKSEFWKATRAFLDEHHFTEVHTPTLEATTGGAEATPFMTHHNDFDIDVYLRISVGELWQKRLMAGGIEKTYEIGRVWRNEGSSPDHLQEFTNMEWYWSYAGYRDGMKLVQEMYRTIAKKVYGKTIFTTRGHTFDLADEWVEIEYRDAIRDAVGIDVLETTQKEMEDTIKKLGIQYDGNTFERLLDTLWKHVRKDISGPAFVIHHPKIVSPLSKSLPEEPRLTERFQPMLAGSELGNGFSELNDPHEQRARFEEQQELIRQGDKEAMMPEWDFVEMLEHGMPPTCGFGFGERLFAFLEDKTIRETTLFPLMRPEESQE